MYQITLRVENIDALEKMLRILENDGIRAHSIKQIDTEIPALITKVSPEMAQRVWDLYQQHNSYRKVAGLTGLGVTTVSRIINDPKRYEVET